MALVADLENVVAEMVLRTQARIKSLSCRPCLLRTSVPVAVADMNVKSQKSGNGYVTTLNIKKGVAVVVRPR